jgi:transposase
VNTHRRSYRTDLSDARWALIEPMLSAWRAGLGIAKIQHDLREIVNAILYVNRTGIAWEYLPHDFPPYKTVHGYFALWEREGITEAIHDALRGKVRQSAGRDAEPTAVILDAQTVKTSGNVPEHAQGIDAGKKIKGTKRHVATDVLGLLLVVLVTAVLSIASGAMTLGRAGRPRRFAARTGTLVGNLSHGLAVGLAAGTMIGVLTALVNGPGEMHLGVITGVGLTLGIGLPVGLTGWLQTPVDEEVPLGPRSVLRADRRATLAMTSILAAVFALTSLFFPAADRVVDGESLAVDVEYLVTAALSPIVIAPAAAFASGSAWLTFSVARIWLALTRRLPWRLMTFLDDAHQRGVLRQTGATYQLRHARLQEQLSARHADRLHSRLVSVVVDAPSTPPRREMTRRIAAAAVLMIGITTVVISVWAALYGHWDW